MNNIKKARSHDTFPRVRKRNSIGNKPVSLNSINAAQRRASLLKNNRNLAVTLQETRCELSAYKDFFEESRDYMNKAKLVKSRMVQLSASLKSFLQAFDENILLLDFDESKWPNIKTAAQSNKNYQKEMNPVVVCDEILEEVSDDQQMNSNVENDLAYCDQMVQHPFNTVQETSDKENPETGNTEGNKDTTRAESNSPKKCPDPVFLQNAPPAPLSSQAVKTTKIPRCRPLSVNLKRQNFSKESKVPKKASKRKSFDKKYEESDPNFSRRKTFVVKSSSVLTESESIRNVMDENVSHSKERLNVPEDELVSKNDKRKTFVLKSNSILKNTEPALCLNKIDKELVTESRTHINETTDVQDALNLEKNRRKTFVKKSNDKVVLRQNDDAAVYQLSFPIKECAVNLEPVENYENNDQSKSIKSSSDFHHSETLTGFAATESEQICAESSKKIECNADVNIPDVRFVLNELSEKVIENDKILTFDGSDASDKAEVMAKNQIDIEAAEKDIEIINEKPNFNDKSQKDENINKVPGFSPVKTRKSFLESSESELDLIVECELDYGDKRPAFKTTPIRRKVPKNKKKKFVFDGNKKNSETGDSHSQKNMEISHSDVNAVNNNEINVKEIKEKNDDIFVSNEKAVNILSETGTVRKKTTKTADRKIKSNQDSTSIKNKTEKNSSKSKKAKKSEKKECDIEIDDLISQPKKIKKKNIKKKKKEAIYNDDNAISKFVEVDQVTKLNEIKETETELESDLPCTKTGKNTFLVRAEIHPPPPSFSVPVIKEIKKKDDKLDLQHMQVTVVLNDVLKSKNVDLLNISNRDILCSRAPSVKNSLSGSSNSFVIDPEESIEKLRCDPVPEADDCDFHTDDVLDIGNSETHGDPVFEIENPRGRRRKPVTYREPSLKQKVRRC